MERPHTSPQFRSTGALPTTSRLNSPFCSRSAASKTHIILKMLKIRRSQDRGKADHGWLKSRFTFSFADYYDPGQMGFRVLRVINDDHIAAGQGFGPHAHRDMEILTYVLEGKVLHRDNTGNRYVLGPNEIQTMS